MSASCSKIYHSFLGISSYPIKLTLFPIFSIRCYDFQNPQDDIRILPSPLPYPLTYPPPHPKPSYSATCTHILERPGCSPHTGLLKVHTSWHEILCFLTHNSLLEGSSSPLGGSLSHNQMLAPGAWDSHQVQIAFFILFPTQTRHSQATRFCSPRTQLHAQLQRGTEYML